MKRVLSATLVLAAAVPLVARSKKLTYPVVDTGQVRTYNAATEISYPQETMPFYGQDAQYLSNAPSYRDNVDGTISDLVTGLMWQKDPGTKMTLSQAEKTITSCRLGGHRDWRIPTIKELYSLIIFSGTDPDPMARSTTGLKPFIDTRYFIFSYGDERKGERIIDSQYGSSTKYVSTTMRSDPTLFGVNFADGRIKGYGLTSPRTGMEKTFYFIFVRGNEKYGENDFRNNRDGTITDRATGLMWMQVDSGVLKAGRDKTGKMNWKDALDWGENLEYAGYSDWRLPNIKELQSIVDYTRSPKTTRSPAIAPIFNLSTMTDEGGNTNYPFYWSSTSHCSASQATAADYIAFGEALGWMEDRRTGKKQLLDVHGAGCQRSDPKNGDPGKYPYGRGPQGDVIRINNYVLCVRGGNVQKQAVGPKVEMTGSPRTTQHTGGKPSFVGRLDKNGDGKVSKSEFDGPSHHFSMLDKNKDGFLSEDEAPRGPPPRH